MHVEMRRISPEVWFGMPQGSVQWPLFYLAIYDLENNIIYSSTIMFADERLH